MEVNDVGRNRPKKTIRPPWRKNDSTYSARRGIPKIEDFNPFPVFVSLAILNHESHVIAVSRKGAALLEKNADIVTAVNRRNNKYFTHLICSP